ncbi:MAG: endo-1,4-beta-xylanase [Candidatus Azobacteroides sp.]|nr:endo-1,4-beta-xylanase [Candidatus Azobacteroides sp.]
MRIYKLFLIVAGIGIMSIFAQVEAQGLKDVYTDFKFGSILNTTTSSNQNMKDLVVSEFNSITPENELKPDQTMVQSGSTDEDIKVQLNAGARRILQFCQDNNISLRGHTLVWHSQTPAWFFRANLTSSGALADTSTMNKRMESYIKNMFALIKNDFPNLNLYAYDVVNEAFKNNGGGLREAGSGTDQSLWTQIYGNDQFIINAFQYARRYAPAECKLFYNDYNEYIEEKRTDIYNLAMKLKAENLIDGIGMQAHLSMSYPSADLFGQAVATFASTGLEIQITENDITTTSTNPSASDFIAQGKKYSDIMKKVLAYKDNVTAFVVWGIQDNQSWRSPYCPLLFDSDGYRKPAYDSLYVLAAGTYPPPQPIKPDVEPDANGYYYYDTFEDGTTQSWISRGNTNVVNTSDYAYEGTKSIFVSGRTANWNGTAYVLDSKAFVPGNSYSFGAMAMFANGGEEGAFKLTLQYNAAGASTSSYATVAGEVSAAKGEWIELLNSNFTIPANATNLLLYVEMSDLLVDFYVDRAFGAIAGKNGALSVPEIQSGNSLKAWKNDDQLHITGIAEGNEWRVYSVTGILVLQGIAESNRTTATLINVPSGVYIVWTEKGTVKVIL